MANAAAPTTPSPPPRLLPLEGGRNFRDMGGYATEDGRSVRWGRLYRSGAMSGLTARDYAHLQGLGIAVICDFRSTEERQAEPIQWPGAPAPQIVSRDYKMVLSDMLETFKRSPSADDVRGTMIRLYKNLPYDHAESYRRLFHALDEFDAPVAFKCAAGKDRTGVAAALVLSALGVRRDEILEDYSLTEKVVDYSSLAAHRPASTGLAEIALLPRELRAPLMRSDPAYLESALAEIERREGSIESYLAAQLGVTAAHTARLRARLLA